MVTKKQEIEMARTITEIYDALIAEKTNFTELANLEPQVDSTQKLLKELTSTSKVAVWRLLFFVVAVGVNVFEVLLDLFNTELEETRLSLITGTDIWYSEKAKVFQLGDTQVWDGVQFGYEFTDLTAQIVAFSSAISEGNILLVKVAKDNGAGLPTKLSISELSSFNSYIQEIGFAGTEILTLSADADTIKLYANIFYDANVLTSTGAEIDNASSFPIETAVTNYLANLNFNGTFRLIDLVDALQDVRGVKNVVITQVWVKHSVIVYTDIFNTTSQTYIAAAGYAEIDGTFPLSGTLTYIAG